MDSKPYLVGISIGLRFGPSFSLSNEFGHLIDNLLYSPDSYFDNKMFPNVVSGPFFVRLENPKTGDYILMSNQDIILNSNFSDTKVKFNDDISPKIKSNEIKHLSRRLTFK